MQRRESYIRQWRLVEELHGSQRGLTVPQLCERVGASRATVYRDLAVLGGAGLPIHSELVNSEARYQLGGRRMPPLVLTPLQLAALRLARIRMTPFEGTTMVREIDGILALAKEQASFIPLSLGDPVGATPAVNGLVERALRDHRQLRFVYAGIQSEAAAERIVDPLGLHLVDNHLYLVAYDLAKDGVRTFKLARMADVEVLDTAAGAHEDVDQDALFANSVKAWSGEDVEVVIRIPARLAGVAGEWPLHASQAVTLDPRGEYALVRAEVAGLIEPMRWVLRWGADAEVVSPKELRDLVARQLEVALARYRCIP